MNEPITKVFKTADGGLITVQKCRDEIGHPAVFVQVYSDLGPVSATLSFDGQDADLDRARCYQNINRAKAREYARSLLALTPTPQLV